MKQFLEELKSKQLPKDELKQLEKQYRNRLDKAPRGTFNFNVLAKKIDAVRKLLGKKPLYSKISENIKDWRLYR